MSQEEHYIDETWWVFGDCSMVMEILTMDSGTSEWVIPFQNVAYPEDIWDVW